MHVRLIALRDQLGSDERRTHRRIRGWQPARLSELDCERVSLQAYCRRTVQEDEVDLALELRHQRRLARAERPRELEQAIGPVRRQAVLVELNALAAAADEAELATGVVEKADLG